MKRQHGIRQYSKKAIISFLILLTSVFAAIACHNQISQPEQLAAGQSSCHIVEHSMGETCVPDNPQNIVALYTPPLASLLAVGVEPIGIAPVTGILDEFPLYLSDKVQDVEIVVNINEEPNLERLLQLKPDLILGWSFHSEIYPLLSRIAPTLLNEPDNGSTMWSDWQSYFKFIAKSVNKEAESEKFIEEYQQSILKLKADLEDRYSDKTISVAQISDDYGIETYVKNSFPGSILSSLGLKRPESQDKSIQTRGTVEAISNEQIDLIDGDILFVLTFNENDNKTLENLLSGPLWRTLKAVQQEQVYFVDGWTWVVPNPLAAQAIVEDLRDYLLDSP
ncbi:MAG: iron-siderophore ABC transporter substrate-binding protein [Cyanobacteria bacterium J06626_4]